MNAKHPRTSGYTKGCKRGGEYAGAADKFYHLLESAQDIVVDSSGDNKYLYECFPVPISLEPSIDTRRSQGYKSDNSEGSPCSRTDEFLNDLDKSSHDSPEDKF